MAEHIDAPASMEEVVAMMDGDSRQKAVDVSAREVQIQMDGSGHYSHEEVWSDAVTQAGMKSARLTFLTLEKIGIKIDYIAFTEALADNDLADEITTDDLGDDQFNGDLNLSETGGN